MALQVVHFALIGGAHGAARPLHRDARVGAALRAQLGEFAEARLENPLQRPGAMAVVDRALVQAVHVVAAPEVALEFLGLRPCLADGEQLAEYEQPAHERNHQQERHHQLHQHAGIGYQGEYRQVLGYVHGWMVSLSCLEKGGASFPRSLLDPPNQRISLTNCGMAAGLKLRWFRQATRISARTSSCAPLRASWLRST